MLPKKGTKAWDKEVTLYLKSTKAWRDKRAKELGYQNRAQYQTMMWRAGISLKETAASPDEATEIETSIINLPPVKLKEYHSSKSIGKDGDPESQGLILGDHQVGLITPTYNVDVFKQRLEMVFQSTLKITTLHRHMYPVNDLEISLVGDMVHGENPYQGAKVEGVSCGARSQVLIALPALAELILSFKQHFQNVRVRAVPGNHGRYDKAAPDRSNWDLMLYDQLKTKLEPYKIDVDISDSWYHLFEIQGHRFFMAHLDQCKGTQGVPWFSLVRKIRAWYITYGGFDYVLGGHWHRDDFLRISSKTKLFVNGSLVTDDPFCEQVIGDSTVPSQWTFGVHKIRGVTWNYSLVVDEKQM
jgi:hypothetical protein